LPAGKLANRNAGLRDIGWEEAMGAWRVVQATIFENIYTANMFRLNFMLPSARQFKYKWFMPETLLVPDGKWHAGSYLGNMTGVLHVVVLLALIPPCFLVCRLFETGNQQEALFMVLSILVLLCLIVLRILSTYLRRKMLEDGLLSIHSCAITWHAVVTAHYRALLAMGGDKRGNVFKSYTWWLSALAADLGKRLEDIHDWIDADDSTVISRAQQSTQSI
jgi:hypothetical protein